MILKGYREKWQTTCKRMQKSGFTLAWAKPEARRQSEDA